MTMQSRERRCVLFDWGNTLMRDIPGNEGPMALWPAVEPLPHAAETLAALHPEWTLALATNAADSDEEEIRKALRRGGMDRWIDRVYCFRKIGHRKPSAEFFSFILRDLGLPPSALVMVGDDFSSDVLGANRVGIPAVWLNMNTPEKKESASHRTLHDLGQLPELLSGQEFPSR